MIKLGQWLGADALDMLHFSTVLGLKREQYEDEVSQVLITHYMQNDKVHKDVRWHNIGKYRTSGGAVTLIAFDLHDVMDYEVDVHNKWIEKTMHFLVVIM